MIDSFELLKGVSQKFSSTEYTINDYGNLLAGELMMLAMEVKMPIPELPLHNSDVENTLLVIATKIEKKQSDEVVKDCLVYKQVRFDWVVKPEGLPRWPAASFAAKGIAPMVCR